MSLRRAKIFLIVCAVFLVFFFSNDFGLIDIEKTAIITAVAVDFGEQMEYEVTAQIAVPEVSSVSSENAKTHIIGMGETVGSAIKNIGDISGWFPNLSFCNLIILGGQMAEDNVMQVLDYFTKTLRIQDSALVVLAEKKASELITMSTPLDNISSFALQKILLKNLGHDQDCATIDIKSFSVGYYSRHGSAVMPFIKTLEENASPESSDGSSSGSSGMGALGSSSSGSAGSDSGLDGKGKTLFDARYTALFKNGKIVGELDPSLTFMLNTLTKKVESSTFEVTDVPWGMENKNFLITIDRATPKINLYADKNQVKLAVSLDIYCKVTDQNTDSSENAYTKNLPLPLSVKERATEMMTSGLNQLIETLKNTECDFLDLKSKLYRYNNARYSQYKDSLYSVMQYTTSVNISGQK